MENPMKNALLVLTCLIVLVAGCQSAAYKEGNYTGQGVVASFSQAATPGVVVSTHADGTVTTVPLGSPEPKMGLPSPVVQIQVIPPQPAVSHSYRLTPEVQTGDQVAGSRVMTWAGEAPGTVVERVATQKQRATHNPLPAVNIDASGIHIAAGGGSTEDQAGQSWWQRLRVWFSDLMKSWSMALLVIGLGVAAFFLLPIFFPVLKPVFASLLNGLHSFWHWATGEIGKVFAWLTSFHKPPVAAPVGALPVPAGNPLTPAAPVAPVAPVDPVVSQADAAARLTK
jgi:hypothetical protein